MLKQFVLAWLLCCVSAGLENAGGQIPIPSPAAASLASKQIAEVFQREIAAAKTTELKLALGKQYLASAADKKEEPAVRFMLWKGARDWFIEAGDIAAALSVGKPIAEEFAIDLKDWRSETIEAAAKQIKTGPGRDALLSILVADATAQLKEGNFEAAEKIAKLAESSAAGARDPESKRSVQALSTKIKKARSDVARYDAAMDTLKTDKNNREANLTAGKYLCFVKGDWESGLPYLAIDDGKLGTAATAESFGASNPSDAVRIGDTWWDLAAEVKGPDGVAMRLRAAHWYRDALPKLSGIGKVKIEKRLADMQQNSAGDAIEPKSTATSPKSKIKKSTNGRFVPGSVWLNKAGGWKLTVTKVKGKTFEGKFTAGKNWDRDVIGVIDGQKFFWLSKDVHANRGGQGGDNYGTIIGDKIELEWRLPNKKTGKGTMELMPTE